jgi:hypothetical protein
MRPGRPGVNHAEFQGEIVGLVLRELPGVHCHYCYSRRSQPGFPDLVIIGSRGVLWRELKVPPDTLRSGQVKLGYRLQASGQDWGVWIPADLRSRLIYREIERIS